MQALIVNSDVNFNSDLNFDADINLNALFTLTPKYLILRKVRKCLREKLLQIFERRQIVTDSFHYCSR